ncbi:MAG: hypothetical protein OXD44_08725 [Gammaproteobacteria bacterium]|nr:hypothetical protein [Gammaproteobacteria bacterium]
MSPQFLYEVQHPGEEGRAAIQNGIGVIISESVSWIILNQPGPAGNSHGSARPEAVMKPETCFVVVTGHEDGSLSLSRIGLSGQAQAASPPVRGQGRPMILPGSLSGAR